MEADVTQASRRRPARACAEATSSVDGLLRIGCLAAVPRLLLEMDADPPAVVAGAGLELGALANPGGTIPYAAMGRLLQAAAHATACPHFGLLVGGAARLPALGLLGRLMQNAPTLGQALRDIVEHQHRYARGGLSYVAAQDDAVTLGYAIYEQGVQGVAQIYDLATSYALQMFRELSGCRPTEVLLPRAAPPNALPYHRQFGVPIRFDSDQAGLVFPRKLLNRPVPGANLVLRKILEQTVTRVEAVPPPTIADQVLRDLRPRVTSDPVNLERTAERMSMHPRTLNRRLQEESTSFRTLLNQSRLEVACQMLESTRLSVTQIALALNYADSTSFSHAFRRFSGRTPSHWRASVH